MGRMGSDGRTGRLPAELVRIQGPGSGEEAGLGEAGRAARGLEEEPVEVREGLGCRGSGRRGPGQQPGQSPGKQAAPLQGLRARPALSFHSLTVQEEETRKPEKRQGCCPCCPVVCLSLPRSLESRRAQRRAALPQALQLREVNSSPAGSPADGVTVLVLRSHRLNKALHPGAHLQGAARRRPAGTSILAHHDQVFSKWQLGLPPRGAVWGCRFGCDIGKTLSVPFYPVGGNPIIALAEDFSL